MTLQLVRKPPIGKSRTERLRVTLNGSHTMKQKLCMVSLAKFWLHEHGIDNAGPTDFYVPLLDPNGHPITNFSDGRLITDFDLVIDSPYHCAADSYCA
jgi:hypothetical protein